MNIATLDLTFQGAAAASFPCFSFLQPESLDDIDILVWNPCALPPRLHDQLEQLDPPVLSVKSSEFLLATSRHWRKEINSLLARGGSVVVLISAPQTVGIHTFQEIMPYDVLEPLLPLKLAIGIVEPGDAACRAGDPFHAFFQRTGDLFEPVATLDIHPGIPILRDNAGRTLAAYYNPVPGRLMILPALSPESLVRPETATVFFSALRHCIERLGHTINVSNAAWLSNYRTSDEQTLHTRHAECLRRIGQLQKQLDLLQEDIDRHEFFKQLLGGESHGVYIAVAELFRRKGAFVQPDWIENDLLLVELGKSYLAVKIRLPGEAVDETCFRKLQQSGDRILDYFGKPVLTLLADCTQNGLPPEERKTDIERPAMARRHGCLYASGIHLYGWHIDADHTSPKAWIERLEQNDEPYAKQPRQAISAKIEPRIGTSRADAR